mmetsp:Transcript_4686/g.11491  ORF Transcript_4686/g.11491 Transcript_4686/m.11491 type:complete len:350 (+) Transcript_4686:274-1323(+)
MTGEECDKSTAEVAGQQRKVSSKMEETAEEICVISGPAKTTGERERDMQGAEKRSSSRQQGESECLAVGGPARDNALEDTASVTSAAVRRVIDVILADAVGDGEDEGKMGPSDAGREPSSGGVSAGLSPASPASPERRRASAAAAQIEEEFLCFWRAREGGSLTSQPVEPVTQEAAARQDEDDGERNHPDEEGRDRIEVATLPPMHAPSLRFGPAKYASSLAPTLAAPDRHVQNPAYFSAEQFFDSLLKLGKQWVLLHAEHEQLAATAGEMAEVKSCCKVTTEVRPLLEKMKDQNLEILPIISFDKGGRPALSDLGFRGALHRLDFDARGGKDEDHHSRSRGLSMATSQ